MDGVCIAFTLFTLVFTFPVSPFSLSCLPSFHNSLSRFDSSQGTLQVFGCTQIKCPFKRQ